MNKKLKYNKQEKKKTLISLEMKTKTNELRSPNIYYDLFPQSV